MASIECALKHWPLMRAPKWIASEFDGYEHLHSGDQFKLDDALWTGEWSDSFANTINAVHQRTRKQFELIERIQRFSQQQLLHPANEPIIRWSLTHAFKNKSREDPYLSDKEADLCLSNSEVERLHSIEPAAPPSIIIHSKASIHYVPSSLFTMMKRVSWQHSTPFTL
jgi:hypothetical protein